MDPDGKRAMFLSVIGPKSYKLLSSLVAPSKPGEKTYGKLVKKTEEHHCPPPSEIVQRYKFHTRERRTKKLIATFVAELRALGQTCGFGDRLEDMIRNRLVCGVKDEQIQRRRLDGMVKREVKDCPQCKEVQSLPATQPMQPWSWPTRPWSRLHIDYAGLLDDQMFMIVVDTHSKWLEVIPLKTATVQTTVQRLQTLFPNFGVSESIVTDNGPQFAATEFQCFCRANGIRHALIAPYHPASNGLAERRV